MQPKSASTSRPIGTTSVMWLIPKRFYLWGCSLSAAQAPSHCHPSWHVGLAGGRNGVKKGSGGKNHNLKVQKKAHSLWGSGGLPLTAFRPSFHMELQWSDTERKEDQFKPNTKYPQWQYVFHLKKINVRTNSFVYNNSWMVTHFKDDSWKKIHKTKKQGNGNMTEIKRSNN